MKKYCALPSWLLMRACIPLLYKAHPWKTRKFTLADWAAGRTSLSKEFDALGWFYLLFVLPFAAALIWRS